MSYYELGIGEMSNAVGLSTLSNSESNGWPKERQSSLDSIKNHQRIAVSDFVREDRVSTHRIPALQAIRDCIL